MVEGMVNRRVYGRLDDDGSGAAFLLLVPEVVRRPLLGAQPAVLVPFIVARNLEAKLGRGLVRGEDRERAERNSNSLGGSPAAAAGIVVAAPRPRPPPPPPTCRPACRRRASKFP